MLFVEVAGRLPGHTFREKESVQFPVSAAAVSETPLDRIELVVNGEVARTFAPQNKRTAAGAYESKVATEVHAEGGRL
jgi:hypothetical protein